MNSFRKRNLAHIQRIFEEKTGVDLTPDQPCHTRRSLRTALILAGILCFGLLLTAFTLPLFTPLDGDELRLSSTYEGNGIVTVFVENKSDKDLEFEQQVKLVQWVSDEEVARLSEDVTFENTRFSAHSSGTMTIDLSGAYDIQALETEHPARWYYLLLTNHSFLFGHDWMCTVSFQPDAPIQKDVQDIAGHISASAEHLEAIDESLRFYFEDAYNDTLPAFNEANFTYLQTVEEYLMRFEGRVITSVSPSMIVGGPADETTYPIIARSPADIIFDETYPAALQYTLVGKNYHIFDGYGRLFGATETEKALVLSALLPTEKNDTDGGVEMPLVYLYTYQVADIQSPDDYAFIYGQLLTFRELEQYKVYEDEMYVIYEATDLIYTDLDAYMDYFISANEGQIYFDETVRQRIKNIYAYYTDDATIGGLFYYNLQPE